MRTIYEIYFDKSKAGHAYTLEEEYMQEQYAFLDMCIAMVNVLMYPLLDTEPFTFDFEKRLHVREIPGSKKDAYACILQMQDTFPKEHRERIKSELQRAREHLLERLIYTPYKGKQFKLRQLGLQLSLNDFEQWLLLLSLANTQDEKYGRIFADLQGREGKDSPTLHLAAFLYSLFAEDAEEQEARILQHNSILMECFLDSKKESEGNTSLLTFCANRRTVSFMKGYAELDRELFRFCEYSKPTQKLPKLLIREDYAHKVKDGLEYMLDEKTKGNVLHLYGSIGNGRRTAVAYGASALGYGVIQVDVEKLEKSNAVEISSIVGKLKQESILLHSVICFVDQKNREESEDEDGHTEDRVPVALVNLLKELCKRVQTFVWISTEKSQHLLRHPLHLLCMEQPMLTVGERIVLWNAFTDQFAMEKELDLRLCANQFILSIQGMRDVLETASMLAYQEERTEISHADIKQAVKQHAPNQLGRYATLIPAVYTWEDLVVSEEQRHQMHLICNQLKYRNVVGEEWGFFKKTAYGRGVCALFYGSPGTGKTMAVQVMANELGLDLYRVDLSQLVSKYIGETEKNISTLFRKARNINALLFFDEADSLFAKRSEVKDSHDRNANAETAHLLQKLEDYEGITILATNYINNIDDAFKRRIKFMVNFSFPTPQVRLQLWNTILPKKVPCEEELDFEYYAEHFELSGSSIKEILTNAAFIAAAQGEALANRHIIEAIKLNFAKYGKIVPDEEFGYLI